MTPKVDVEELWREFVSTKELPPGFESESMRLCLKMTFVAGLAKTCHLVGMAESPPAMLHAVYDAIGAWANRETSKGFGDA